MHRITHLLMLAFFFLMAIVLLADHAFAQSETTVDFTPVINQLLTLAAAVLAAVGTWAAKRLATRFGVEIDERKGKILDEAIHNGIGYAINIVRDRIAARAKVNVESEVLRMAATYVRDKTPGALAHFNITEQRLVEMVKARLDRDKLPASTG